MQTFLPYEDLEKSVKSLDYRRLGKQRVEAMQLLSSIYIEDYSWRSHPASKMWRPYPEALQMYMDLCIDEWVSRGYKNTMTKSNIVTNKMPIWLGDERLHASHRSNLLKKDLDFYSVYQWREPNDLPYFWCGYADSDKDNYSSIEPITRDSLVMRQELEL